MRRIERAVIVVACVLVGVGFAQAKMKESKVVTPPSVAPAEVLAEASANAAAPTAEAMAAMQQLSSPSEGHKALEPLVGTWTYTAQWWMTPDAAPQMMTGTVVNGLIFGGRFLKQDFHGTVGDGQPPFEGLGLLGYDNIRKAYQSVWCDNMATGMMTSTGTFDAATSTLTEQGDVSCPITGEAHRPYRSALTVVDTDHHTYESYMRGPDGQEYRAMEILYTRSAS